MGNSIERKHCVKVVHLMGKKLHIRIEFLYPNEEVTVCQISAHDGSVVYWNSYCLENRIFKGVAKLHEGDAYVKELGETVAFDKAYRKFVHNYINAMDRFFQKECKLMGEAFKTVYYAGCKSDIPSNLLMEDQDDCYKPLFEFTPDLTSKKEDNNGQSITQNESKGFKS